MILEIETSYGLANVEVLNYENGRIALILKQKGRHLATLTVNIPEYMLEDGEFFVKTWSENESIAAGCLNSGHFIDTGKRVGTGFVEASVWRFK